MKKRLVLLVMVLAGALIVPVSVVADEVRDEAESTWNETWPEEVPTPWFCHGVGPHMVCVPPW